MSYLIFNSENRFVRIAKDDLEKNLIIGNHPNIKTIQISESDFFKLKYTSRGIDPNSTPDNWSFSTGVDNNGKKFFTGTDFEIKENNAFFDDNGNLEPYNSSNPKHIIRFALDEKELKNHINEEKKLLKNVLNFITSKHSYYNKLNEYYNVLENFDISTITYPMQLSLLQHLDNKSLSSISPLQYPI